MKRFLTRRNIIILIVLALVIGGIGWSRARSAQTAAKQETAKVEKRTIERTLVASGQVKAANAATLNFPAPGKLAYLSIVEGQSVNKWQALAGLDKGDLAASERAAYYRYLAADANAKETEDAVKNHDGDETFAQKNDRVSAQTTRDIAYDTWLTAKRALTNSSLYAPFAGVVTGTTVTAVGDTVGATDAITIVDPNSIYFEIEIDEVDLGLVEEGMSVTVSLDAFDGREFVGTLSKIGFVSQTSSTGANVFLGKITFNPEDLSALRLGMNGDAEMVLAKVENVLSLPVESVSDNEVVVVGQETPVTVETGLEGDEYIEIKSGLKEGDTVVR